MPRVVASFPLRGYLNNLEDPADHDKEADFDGGDSGKDGGGPVATLATELTEDSLREVLRFPAQQGFGSVLETLISVLRLEHSLTRCGS